MNLRSASSLKFFVLLIFLTEFLLPAFTFSPAIIQSKKNEQFFRVPDNQNLLFTIFTSELNENKEGREDNLEVLPLIDISFTIPFFRLPSSQSVGTAIACSNHRLETSPQLFKLYRALLI